MLVGTLDFGARVLTAGLKTGAKQAQGVLRSSLGQLVGAGFGLRLGQNLADAVVQGIQSAARRVTQTITTMRDEADSAMELGFTSDKAFQAWKHMADTPEEMVGRFEKMRKFFGNLKLGETEERDIAQQLGLTPDAIQGAKTAEEQVYLLSEAFKRFGISAEGTALASRIFGRSAGADMAEMLSGGRAGMEAYIKEAEKLGVAFSNTDNNATKLAWKSLKDMKLSVEGLWRTLGVNLAPAIKAAADAIKNWLVQMNQTGAIQAFGKTVVGVFEVVLNVAHAVAMTFKAVQGAIMAMASATVNIGAEVGVFDPEMAKAMREEMRAFQDEMQRLVKQEWWGTKFSKDIDKAIADARKMGRGAVGEGAGQMMVGKAWNPAAALLRGSVEAASAINKARALSAGQGVADNPVVGELKQHRQILLKANASLDEINAALRDTKVGDSVIIPKLGMGL